MADISHDELLQSLGDTAASFTKRVANEAATFTCGLYRQYPWALTFGDWGNYKKGFWDQMCGKRPGGLPPDPVAPFKGGQCPTVYTPYLTFSYENLNATDRFNFASLWGEIASIRATPVASGERGPYGPYFDIEFVSKGDAGSPRQTEFITTRVNRFGSFKRLEKIEVIRRDNQPDNCGDLPAEHPQIPIPPAARSTTVNIDVAGTIYNIPITFQPITNKYELNLKAGDLSLDFDFGGVHINRNSVDFNTLNEQVSNITNNVSNLAQNFATYYNNSTAYSSSFNLYPFRTNSSAGGSAAPNEEASDDLAYVTVLITRHPSNAKTQEGYRAQDIIYAGWFQFVSEGFYYPREPIHFIKSIFKAPPGATSFAYTLYHGFEAIVVEHRA